MCMYETGVGDSTEPDVVVFELGTLPDCGASPYRPGISVRSEKTRLVATRIVPADRVFQWRESGGQESAGIRSETDFLFYGKPRQPAGSFYVVLRDTAAGARLGARVALQDSDLWLAHEALWERAGAKCA